MRCKNNEVYIAVVYYDENKKEFRVKMNLQNIEFVYEKHKKIFRKNSEWKTDLYAGVENIVEYIERLQKGRR